MNKKIRIGFVNYSLDIGGVETLILEIGKKLDRNLFEPLIFVFMKDGKLKKEYIKDGIQVIEVDKKYGFDWLLSIRLAKVLKANFIDIVHTHNPTNWLYGGIAAKIAGIPIVHTQHTASDYNNYHVKRWSFIERNLSKFTSVITTVAGSVKKHMVEKSRINSEKIKVIYNAVRAKDFEVINGRDTIKTNLGLKKDYVVIGNIARFFENKDHETLLKSYKQVAEKIPCSYLLLIGDGHLKSKVEELARKLELSEKVIFLGNRRDIADLMSIMDIFVLSSKREGLPVVILEAMASSLPVVATDVDGNAEVVIHGETGLVVPSGRPDLLAGALCELTRDLDISKKMGEKGRKRIEEFFTFEHMVSEYQDIYKSIFKKSTNKRICVAGEFPPPDGGMGLQARLFVEKMQKEGFFVQSVMRNKNFKYLSKIKILRTVVRFFYYVLNLLRIVPRVGIVHVFSNSYLDYFLYTAPAVIVTKFFRKKSIIHYHGGAAEDFLKKYSFLIKLIMKLSDEIVVPSDFLKDIFNEYKIDVKVIPNICNFEKLEFKKREDFLPNFIVTRNMEKIYNIQCAIRAFFIIKEKYKSARLRLLGDGNDRENLERLVDELGLSESVDFLGRVDNNNISSFYAQADFFINPSSVDNMPVSVLEAFASGLPVISTNVGGLKYLIKDGVTGLMVESNDHVRMSERIFELLENKDLAKQLIINARELVNEFSWDNIKDEWTEVYLR
ncbi:MAG: glycosyltransferase [Candidatus Omnitrophica bacterium]|nr:glycosyltransferase [Candidatus Omnitrophota bacterium]